MSVSCDCTTRVVRIFEEVAHGLHEGVSAADVVVDGDGVVRLVTK